MHCIKTLWAQIAAALKAEKLILMTDVPGVLRDKDDISTKFTALDIRQVRELVADGIIAGGMIPKCARTAPRVLRAWPWPLPHALSQDLRKVKTCPCKWAACMALATAAYTLMA